MRRFFQITSDATARKILAALLMLVFAQGFTNSFLHLELQRHFLCVEHAHVTHDAEHAARALRNQGDATDFASRPAGDKTEDSPDDERETAPDGCQWLTWLHDNSISYPHLQPELLNLPPPAVAANLPLLRARPFVPSPIELRHVSPMNSPPSA